MNRDIKFRVWDKEYKEMYYSTDEGVIIDFSNMGTEVYLIDEYRELIKFKLMQYIGLKDKNNVEIYEGDIVSILDENICDDEYFAVKYINIDGRYELESEGLTLDFDNIFSCQCEVIGNIYDNPELLEESEE